MENRVFRQGDQPATLEIILAFPAIQDTFVAVVSNMLGEKRLLTLLYLCGVGYNSLARSKGVFR